MSKNTGGPAFPCSNEQFTAGNSHTGDAAPGMTLRDWFAGQALAQIIADGYVDYEHAGWQQRISSSAYEIADAMLVERSKP